MEFKSLAFNITETKQEVINGQEVGILKGHAAAFTKDRVDDIIEPGAFFDTLKDHMSRGSRQIRMKFQHKRDEIIGGFPVDLAREDSKGLFVEGHINLEVQRGREVFSLAKQGVLQDMSIGFIIPEGGQTFSEVDGERVRIIKAVDLREISIVDEPANMDAQITEIKSRLGSLGVEFTINEKETIDKKEIDSNDEDPKNLDNDSKGVIIENEMKLDTLKKVEDRIRGLGLSRKESKTIISLVKNVQRDAVADDTKIETSRDASVEKLDQILLIQQLEKLTSTIKR